MAGIVCSICGSATSFTPELLEGKGIIDADSEYVRYADVKLPAVSNNRDVANYAIIRCQSCGETFVALDTCEGWIAVYPIRQNTVAEEIPNPVKQLFNEAYLCFAVDAYIGCLMLCRTALINLQRQQNVSNLFELKSNGIISEMLYKQADEIRLWANMLGHDDVSLDNIDRNDTEQLLLYMEALLDAVYVQPARHAAIQDKRKQMKNSTGYKKDEASSP